MAEKKESMDCGDCRMGGTCRGMSGDHWMSHSEFTIARGLLTFVLMLFVFWIGMAIGEMKAFLREEGGFGPGYMMMRQANWDTNAVYAPRGAVASPSSTPAPKK